MSEENKNSEMKESYEKKPLNLRHLPIMAMNDESNCARLSFSVVYAFK